MDYFYGGKRGFSFILRPNQISGSNGYWRSLNEIRLGITSGWLKYGDYAIITENVNLEEGEDFQYSGNHGKIYRIDRGNNPVLVGKIGNPALLYKLILTNNNENTSNIVFNFLNDEASKAAEGVQGFWKTVQVEPEGESDSGWRVGLGFTFPKPVIEFESVTTDNFNEELSTGIEFDEETYRTARNAQGHELPMYFPFKNIIPPNIFIGNYSERTNKDHLFNTGDLWLRVFDPDEDNMVPDQISISLNRKKIINDSNSRFYFYENYTRVSHGGSWIYQSAYHPSDISGENTEIKAFNPFDGTSIGDSFNNNITIIFKEDCDEADLLFTTVENATIIQDQNNDIRNYMSLDVSFYEKFYIRDNSLTDNFLTDKGIKYFTDWQAIYAPVGSGEVIDYSILLTVSGKINGADRRKTRIQFYQYNQVQYSQDGVPFELKNIASYESEEEADISSLSHIRLCALVLFNKEEDPEKIVQGQNIFDDNRIQIGNEFVSLHDYCYDQLCLDEVSYCYNNNYTGRWLCQYIISGLSINYLL